MDASLKLWALEAEIQGTYEKQHAGMKLKVLSVWVSQFWVNSLFYTWTFIKSEFLRTYSAWCKHTICLSWNKLFQHSGILYWSWIALTVCLLLLQRMPWHR